MNKVKKWFDDYMKKEEYYPSGTTVLFMVASFCALLAGKMHLVVSTGFLAVILLMMNIIVKLNKIRSLLYWILRAQPNVYIVSEKSVDKEKEE